jgi:hypothetical protein
MFTFIPALIPEKDNESDNRCYYYRYTIGEKCIKIAVVVACVYYNYTYKLGYGHQQYFEIRVRGGFHFLILAA